MNRRFRLTKTSDFKRVRRAGRLYAHPLAVLIADSNGLAVSRFGITAGRAVGGAVGRNRTKRRLREALRKYWPDVVPGWDAVLIARPPAAEAAWSQLLQAIGKLLEQAGMLER
ncbi:MAG: ribonuclease P protein component [Anaerolineales bacterium]|jgi:ribonuclease P protein component